VKVKVMRFFEERLDTEPRGHDTEDEMTTQLQPQTQTQTRTRPLIGYVARSSFVDPELHIARFANNESYAFAIARNGGAPVMIPPVGDEEAFARVYEALDGLLLTGGPDVEPVAYGQERHALTDGGDPPMEQAEFYLLRRALAGGLPVLGICRGLQVLNVVAGGTLYQDLAYEFGTAIAHPAYADGRAALVHKVHIREGSRLRAALGSAEVGVNSLHHQGIHDLAPGLTATGVAPDGLIEAIERPDLPFVVAVQWHPEELYREDEAWAGLFRAFVDAASAYRAPSPPTAGQPSPPTPLPTAGEGSTIAAPGSAGVSPVPPGSAGVSPVPPGSAGVSPVPPGSAGVSPVPVTSGTGTSEQRGKRHATPELARADDHAWTMEPAAPVVS